MTPTDDEPVGVALLGCGHRPHAWSYARALTAGSAARLVGVHDTDPLLAHSVGFGTVQLFTKSNNQWKAADLTDGHVAAFKGALAETGVGTPVAHNSYLINLASPPIGQNFMRRSWCVR